VTEHSAGARLENFDTLTLDCYGTLIDWESGMIAALTSLTDRLPALGRDEILQAHAFHESEQQRQTPTKPYREILTIVYRRLAEGWGVAVGGDECARYGESVKDWPAFPDASDALMRLSEHYLLIILSNVDHQSFAASSQKLGVVFDAIFTAEDIGSYKPADANFVYMLAMLDRLGVEKSNILHTAESMFHDHEPANRHGLASCWIHRRHDKEGFGATRRPQTMPNYDFRFTSMAEMADARAAEAAG
jgi:2-haloacid dehalogenase